MPSSRSPHAFAQGTPPAKIADVAWLQGYWVEFEGSLRFVVKHFHPDWVGWEEKDQAFRARLTRVAPREAVFGGIVFRLEGDATLIVQLRIRGKDGRTREERLRYKRRPL